MSKRRFNGLEHTLKNIAVLSTPDAPIVPPAGSKAANYLAYKGKAKKYTIETPTAKGSTKKFGIVPFGASDVNSIITVKVGKRALDNMDECGLTQAALGYNTTDIGSRNDGFTPARIIITHSTGDKVEKESAITGGSYKKKSTVKSFTYPFGVVTNNTTTWKAKKTLAGLANTKITDTLSVVVTFKDETGTGND